MEKGFLQRKKIIMGLQDRLTKSTTPKGRRKGRPKGQRMESVSEAASRIWIHEPFADQRALVHQQSRINFPREMADIIKKGCEEYNEDFYIFIITPKLENQNAISTIFNMRNSCPPPNYNQMVYKFLRHTMQPKVLWIIPSRATTEWLYYGLNIPKKWNPLKRYAVEFVDGTLDKLYYSLESKEKLDD